VNLFKLVSFIIPLFLISYTSTVMTASADEEKAEVAAEIPLSPATRTCIGCHSNITPGIVKDWLTSRHSKITASAALEKPLLEKRVSADNLPKDLAGYAVGCYECHSLNAENHKDNFEHMGRRINIVVTPEDCKTCHPAEVGQFSGSKKYHARKILLDNPVYKTLVDTTTGIRTFGNNTLKPSAPSESTLHETCFGCHGTKVEVKGLKSISTKLGDMQIPDLTNWPNQGVGRVNPDGSAGACTACHNSLLVSSNGGVIAERTHNFGSRLWVRLFGLIYSHPQPKSGDTTIIKNKDGLPLPVTFTGEPASEYLIDKTEQSKRLGAMSNICGACHGSQWSTGHFAKLDNTIKETDEMTLTATKLMADAWGKGIEDKSNPFDETLEQMWVKQWLFYCNSIRYSSAMSGAPDYTSFKNGWWNLNENLRQMKDWMELKRKRADKE